jgi:hypothetical protein
LLQHLLRQMEVPDTLCGLGGHHQLSDVVGHSRRTSLSWG